ncbi:fibronectin type III domain-containing protein [Flagellimonas sp.]|uniref:fibronectin type III domain-containing protein n=1 Tax=Flagellimonas sp. TaxID=2058762 RepID=UPI003BAEF42C
MKHLLAFGAFTLFTLFISYSQTNLLDTSTWTLGSDYLSDFPRYGSAAKNVRELDYGPHSTTQLVIIWKGLADDTSTNDGGWLTPYMTIDPSKEYRLTVWLKKINSNDGNTYFGFNALDASDNSASLNLDGTANNNPYFGSSNVSFLSFNEWYLFVAYVNPHTHTSTTIESGIYSTDGTKVASLREFKFAPTATKIRHRAFLIDDNNLDELHFYEPTIYEVNGQEPTIAELLNPSVGNDTQAPSVPTGLQSTAQSQTTVDLSWNSSTDDVGVTNYRVYKDGVLDGTSGNLTSYQATGLTSGIAYDFTVSALDAAENESSQSTSISVTMDTTSGGGGGSSVWSETGSTASYTGDVVIGTSAVPSGYKLAVDGDIRTREIRVDQDNWPDYVFDQDYDLPTLEEIKSFIEANGHLPKIPSAEEVTKHGTDLGKMDRLLLEKIEQLTLYVLEQQKEIQHLKVQLKNQNKN